MDSLWYIIILVFMAAFLVGFLRNNGLSYFRKKVYPDQCLKSLLTSAITTQRDPDNSHIDFKVAKDVKLDEIPLQDFSRACKILNYVSRKLPDRERVYPKSITLCEDAGKYYFIFFYPEDPTHNFQLENEGIFLLDFQLEKIVQWGKGKKIEAIWRQVIDINQNIHYISPS